METLTLGGHELPLGDVTHVMGVINTSPESKNRHTVATSVAEVLAMADRYRAHGASLIDLGGQSSHYDNPTIAEEQEISRVVPAVEALASAGHLVAVDTWKPAVAAAALDAGAVIVNDTGGLADPEMRRLVADRGVAVVAVYVEAANPHQVGEVIISPDKAAVTARRLGSILADLADEGIHQVILDPGIALNYRGDYQAYTRMQLEVIAGSHHIKALGRPLLVPIPRKAHDHWVAAYIAMALHHEADIIRAHDVEMACDLARLFGRSG
jgi:dihydropteroate synthase